MNTIDWSEPATLQARDDGGSDLHYHFEVIAKGPLGDLVRQVAALPAHDRARMVIDRRGGTLNVGEIMALAQREDLP